MTTRLGRLAAAAVLVMLGAGPSKAIAGRVKQLHAQVEVTSPRLQ